MGNAETYRLYLCLQDRSGLGNGLDMRSLEHCLSDIMRGVGDGGPPDHLKGKICDKPSCHMTLMKNMQIQPESVSRVFAIYMIKI